MKLFYGGLIGLVAVVGVSLGLWKLNKENTVPALLPETVIPEIEKKTEIHSSDGVMNLIASSKRLDDGTSNYVFRVVKRSDNTASDLFSKGVGSGVTMEIPFNSWSPDNKQVFVIERDGSVTKYFVYRVDGSSYKNGELFLEVSSLWSESLNKYIMRDITGWEGNDLLGIRTTSDDGTAGPRYWFVISSRSFMVTRRL